MNKIRIMTAVAMLSMAGAVFGADKATKFNTAKENANQASVEFRSTDEKAIQAVVEKVNEKLASAPFTGKGVMLWPVIGDQDKFCEDLLRNCLIDAGVNVVMPKDVKDPHFANVLLVIQEGIRDGRGIRSLDSKTLDELGHLKSINVFLEGKLKLEGNSKRRRVAKLRLTAYEVLTKKYIWGCYLTSNSADDIAGPFANGGTDPSYVPKNQTMNISVKVEHKDNDSEALAERVASATRSALANLGYIVDGANTTPDIELSVMVKRKQFDSLGEFFVFDGNVQMKARLIGSEERTLAETIIDEHGTRGLGTEEAERNLADKMVPRVEGWLEKSLSTDVLGLASESFSLAFADRETITKEIPISEEFRREIAKIKGVRSVSVLASDISKNAATFRVIYDKKVIRNSIINVLLLERPELGNKLAD